MWWADIWTFGCARPTGLGSSTAIWSARYGRKIPSESDTHGAWAHHEDNGYTGRVRFTWDPTKAAENLQKHGVDFREAATVFDDPLSTTFQDADHSEGEQRFLIIGMSALGRILVVSHTDTGGTIRIISARSTTRREKHFYEDNDSNSH